MQKADFDQRLDCAAPKRWSKYKTTVYLMLYKLTIFLNKLNLTLQELQIGNGSPLI